MNEIKATARELTMWVKYWVPPEPHQEHLPYMQLFRPLQTTQWHLMSSNDEDDYRI